MAGDGSQQRKPDFKAAIEKVKAVVIEIVMGAESVLGRRTSRFLGVLVLFILVVSTLLVFLNWYIAPSSAEQRQALVVTLAQILGGTALLSGLYFTWRALQVNREGQITERFTRAIDQLGKTDNKGTKLLEIRLGGIYALERIARESKEDYWPIMEVLTAYVRRHAPSRQEGEYRYFHEWEEYKQYLSEERKSEEYSSGDSEESGNLAPPLDVRAIMTVLRRRTHSYGHGESEHLDLQVTNHFGGNLLRADLSGAYLRGANLREAYLRGANLREAYLWAANLQEADLQEADISEADLSGANLSEADLSGVNFREANLQEANLQEAKGITHDQIESAMGSRETRLPGGFGRPEWWSYSIEEQKNIIRERLGGERPL